MKPCARFSEDGKQICVYGEMPLNLHFENLSARSPMDQEELSRDLQNKMHCRFLTCKWALFRVGLFALSEDEFYLTITAHILFAMDGLSASSCRTLENITQFPQNISPDLKPAPSLSDYAAAQNKFYETDEYKKIEQYWTALQSCCSRAGAAHGFSKATGADV
jgi:hypothetical protein